jgi:Zn-dependent peptidase ImmA (M78 family)/DNA-binding XRE family transcriptional regulator
MGDKAYITSKVLKWARESARISLEDAASKVDVTPEKLEEWENGTSYPTIKKAEILAKTYKRPFALFFLPEIPRDFQPLQDFRRKTSKELGTASIFIIREIQQKQAWISEVFIDNAEPALTFVGKFSINSDPQVVAKDILKTLQINPGNYNTDNPIKEWIDKAEKNGIFVSRTSFIHTKLLLDSDEMQGFAIADKHAPFIFVNSDDWNAPQLFTIVHELAHIWIAESGVSNEIDIEPENTDNLNPIELFCNEVAASSLMPSEIIRNLEQSTFSTSSDIFKAAKKMGVSSYALLVRAYKLQLIPTAKYWRLKKEIDLDFQAFLKREEEKKVQQRQKDGGPSPYLLRLNKNSRLFTQIVLDSFKGGFIEATMASNLLNTQVNNFPKLEAYLYR